MKIPSELNGSNNTFPLLSFFFFFISGLIRKTSEGVQIPTSQMTVIFNSIIQLFY